MVVVVVVMVEDHMVVEVVEEVIIGKVCVQLVYYLVGVCFIQEEMNCFCVIFAFMILFAICSNSNQSINQSINHLYWPTNKIH